MGSSDTPPPHVPAHLIPTCNLFLQTGSALWGVCYLLFVRESFKARSYGMPLFSAALNFGWEVVCALYVADSPLEKFHFTAWAVLDGLMILGIVKFAKYEWKHAPAVARNMGAIFTVLALVATIAHWTFAKWWIQNDIGKREGKFYRGVIGPDTTELGFWSAMFCQAYLSAASLSQLVVRQHSGGVSWSIW